MTTAANQDSPDLAHCTSMIWSTVLEKFVWSQLWLLYVGIQAENGAGYETAQNNYYNIELLVAK